MLMTPARQQRKASKTCKPNWRNKKQPAAVAPRKGNCATGCHFRPYSFASSPFDDFADMKNITRKTVCQGVSAPPHGRPPTIGCAKSLKDDAGMRQTLPIVKKHHVNTPFCRKRTHYGEEWSSAETRCSGIPTTPRCRALALLTLRPSSPHAPILFAICGYHLRSHPRCCINSGLIYDNAVVIQLDTL